MTLCCLQYCGDGEYLIIHERPQNVALDQGGHSSENAERAQGLVWSIAARPNHNDVAIGTNDGEIELVQMLFATVHGLYKERYAYRDYMTDVIIQHLITDQKVRIKCHDYVKKIAVYKDRLAVQLPDRIILYEVMKDGSK